MKTSILVSITAFALMTMVSCGDNTSEKETEKAVATENSADENHADGDCHYVYKEGSAMVGWTAFKTTSKAPVGGKFTKVKVRGNGEAHGLAGLLETIEFSIATSSTSTNDTIRDGKIIESFFKKMVSTDFITGTVASAKGDDTNGTCTFMLKMNNVEREIPLEYVFSNDTITITGGMDILDFQADNALSALNDACKDLHMGADGVSKTWSTVDLSIRAAIVKDCH